MKNILLLIVLLASCKEEPRTIKSSDIKDGAVTNPKLSGGEIGIKFDQKTGRIVELMYKSKSYVPIEERDSLRKLVKRYRCEFETIQDAHKFLDSRDSCCCDAMKVRSIEL